MSLLSRVFGRGMRFELSDEERDHEEYLVSQRQELEAHVAELEHRRRIDWLDAKRRAQQREGSE